MILIIISAFLVWNHAQMISENFSWPMNGHSQLINTTDAAILNKLASKIADSYVKEIQSFMMGTMLSTL